MNEPGSAALSDEVKAYLENWVPPLTALTLPQVDVPLSLREAAALGRSMLRFGGRFPPVEGAAGLLNALLLRLDVIVRRFSDGAFVRLGSRSPKDSRFVRDIGGRVFGGRMALMCLTEGSQRVADDLEWAILNNYPPHIFVRPWIEIPPWSELRCFMLGRKLVGVSQYNGVAEGCSFPELLANAAKAFEAVQVFFRGFALASHLDDCVFDVLVRPTFKIGGVDVLLLEIGPFGSFTDMLLFGRGGNDFDGSFRFLDSDGNPVSLDGRSVPRCL